VTDELRCAKAAYELRRTNAADELRDAAGAVAGHGTAEAEITDDSVSVGPVTIAFLDADTLRVADYRIEIGCWPSGMLVLTELGRRFDAFAAELRKARDHARVAGLLAHGVAMPAVFSGAILGKGASPAVDCHVYDTHLTFVSTAADPWQLPLGALTTVEAQDDPPAVVLGTADGPTVVGQLARMRDEFLRAVTERRDAQAQLLETLTGVPGFADGLGVERSRVPGFERLVARFTAQDRTECAAALLKAAKGGEPRLGFVQMLDPDAESLQSPEALPEGWASFLLVPVGALAVMEILAGPSAATYVFAAPMADVGRDLQLLHFRRGALALSGKDAEPAPGNPWRLALRRLEPLRRLRAATRARLIHSEGWAEALLRALG
jgi:hypothetical protein